MPFAVPYRPARRIKMRQGFTLIELLVVVLIIGILTAVALPKYQAVIGKTQAITIIQRLDAIYKAQQLYYMANGEYAESWDDLDIEIKGHNVTHNRNLYFPDGSYCIPMPTGLNSARCYLGSKKVVSYLKLEIYFAPQKFTYNKRLECGALPDEPLAQRICKSLIMDPSIEQASCGSAVCNYTLDKFR